MNSSGTSFQACHLSVQERAPELRKREAGLHQLDDASETSGEPGGSASGDLLRLVLGTFFRFFVLLCAQLLEEVDGWIFSYAAASILWRRRSKPARPYMERLMAFNRLICPSTGPVLQDSVRAACTAS